MSANFCLASLAVTVLASSASTSALAQSFSVVRNFGVLTNVTGLSPNGVLTAGPDGSLCGTTSAGDGFGTVFRMDANGSNFRVLKLFTKIVEGVSPQGSSQDSSRSLGLVRKTGISEQA